MKMYHLAPTALREQIAQEGLRPFEPTRWGPHAQANPEGVYLFPSAEEAEFRRPYIEYLAGPTDLWEVEVDDVIPDNAMTNSFFSPVPIPPVAIRRTAATKNYDILRAQKFLREMYPVEEHNVGGDCINPKCDAEFTQADLDEMALASGWHTCPQCQYTYNYLEDQRITRSGLTPEQMGQIGETIVERLGTIPLLGEIIWSSPTYNDPLDLIAGEFGVEVKTNHSEAQPRFKLGGGGRGASRSGTRLEKLQYCEENGLRPALVGVRLNFYTDIADIFVRPDSMTDTWIGNAKMPHVRSVSFEDLNPFKRPEDVPPPAEMPDDDDSDIPF